MYSSTQSMTLLSLCTTVLSWQSDKHVLIGYIDLDYNHACLTWPLTFSRTIVPSFFRTNKKRIPPLPPLKYLVSPAYFSIVRRPHSIKMEYLLHPTACGPSFFLCKEFRSADLESDRWLNEMLLFTKQAAPCCPLNILQWPEPFLEFCFLHLPIIHRLHW